MNYRTLVLNADYRPLTVVSWKRAIVLIADDKATMLDFYAGKKIHDTKGRAYAVPAVILKNSYVKRNYSHAPFNRKNVLLRDSLVCQYCGTTFPASKLTFDHVIPKSRWNKDNGSPTVWENIVACCLPCNSRKGNKTCRQAGMEPINKPVRPAYGELFLGLSPFRDRVPTEWAPYLRDLPLFKRIGVFKEVNATTH